MRHDKVAFLTAAPLSPLSRLSRLSRPSPLRRPLQQAALGVTRGRRAAATACAAAGGGGSGGAGRGDRLVVVGLGNPGSKYAGTRHNVGFAVVEAFARRHGGEFAARRSAQAAVAEVVVGGRRVSLVKPRTYMNLSGAAVRAALRGGGARREGLLVVADDMRLEVGRVRLRARGSAGGHNGLKSVEAAVGSREYCRLKVGVGEAAGGAEGWSEHVLGRFSKAEEKVVEAVVMDCVEVLELWVAEAEVDKVMSQMGKFQQGRR